MAKAFTLTNERAKQLRETAQQVLDESGDWRVAAEDLYDFFDTVADMTEPAERVVFRKFPKDGAVIALFPDQYSERTGMIGSYMELGQHSDTVPDFGDTKPADETEYAPLLAELRRQGYHNLKVVKRLTIKK